MLDHFFAVTITSIYEIFARGRDNRPVVQKIALDGPSVFSIGQELETGTMVAIGKMIINYIPEGGGLTSFERRVESVNTCYFTSNTSRVVALFLTYDEAKECFRHKDRTPGDKRWLAQTRAVIEAIGPDHPIFYICEQPTFRLLP